MPSEWSVMEVEAADLYSPWMCVMQRGQSTASEHQRWAGSANGLAACMQHQLRLAENGHAPAANGSHSGLCSDLGSDAPSEYFCTLPLAPDMYVCPHIPA